MSIGITGEGGSGKISKVTTLHGRNEHFQIQYIQVKKISKKPFEGKMHITGDFLAFTTSDVYCYPELSVKSFSCT